MQKMMLAVCVILGLVMGPVFIQACDPGEFAFVDVLIILSQRRDSSRKVMVV